MNNKYDNMIIKYADRYNLPPALIKAMIKQESDFNPGAVSVCGARGLMQIMPATAGDLDVMPEELYDPETNIQTGARYLRYQFDMFTEIPLADDRYKFSLAAYNGGRGYVNKALYLARKAVMNRQAGGGGQYQWQHVKKYLKSNECRVRGKRPDADQMIHYVDTIWNQWLPEAQASLTPADHKKRGLPNVV